MKRCRNIENIKDIFQEIRFKKIKIVGRDYRLYLKASYLITNLLSTISKKATDGNLPEKLHLNKLMLF
jgi:hypothetical protein